MAANHLRHEFAHAWDNVRSGKNPKSLRKIKPDAQTDEITARAKESAPFGSDSSAKLLPSKRPMEDLASDYKKILAVDREKFSFAHETTPPKHATSDVHEFYAEGYSVFHGFGVDKQARMFGSPGISSTTSIRNGKASASCRPTANCWKRRSTGSTRTGAISRDLSQSFSARDL